MLASRVIRIFGLLMIAMMAIASGAQPSPRAAPVNDYFDSPKPLPLGASAKVKDPAAAGVEVGEPDACGLTPFNSVWFKFAPVTNGSLYLSTAGTLLISPGSSSYISVLSVYTGTDLGSLTPLVCSEGFAGTPSEVSFGFVPEETYYIQLTTLTNVAYTPQSFYKLTSRITLLYFPPQNRSFETPLSPADWTLKNGSNDGIVCGDATYTSYEGNCAFKFTGSPGESSVLKQTVTLPAGYHLRRNGLVQYAVLYRAMDSLAVESAKITATLIYANGTPSQKIVLNLTGIPAGGYEVYAGMAYLADGSLSRIKLKINHKSTAGVLLVDLSEMYYAAGAFTREQGDVLSVPSAPAR